GEVRPRFAFCFAAGDDRGVPSRAAIVFRFSHQFLLRGLSLPLPGASPPRYCRRGGRGRQLLEAGRCGWTAGLLHLAVALREPVAHLPGIVMERAHSAAIGDAALFVDDIEALGPGGVGVVGGVAEIVGDENTLREILRLRVANVFLDVRFHLPFVGRMRLANVNGQEIDAVLVVLIELNDVAHLAAEGRSSKAAEDEHKGTAGGALAKVKAGNAVERDDAGVRRVVAELQRSAVHVRKRIADHTVGVLRTAGEDGEADESGENESGENSQRPFPEAAHGQIPLRQTIARSAIETPGGGWASAWGGRPYKEPIGCSLALKAGARNSAFALGALRGMKIPGAQFLAAGFVAG